MTFFKMQISNFENKYTVSIHIKSNWLENQSPVVVIASVL